MLLILSGLSFFILAGLFFIGYFSPKSAGLNIYTNEESSVFLDGELAGKTPFQKTLKARDVILKIIPASELDPFETKLSLTPGIETVVIRDFDKNDFTSAGETISFEKISTKNASFSIVSTPNSAEISIDGSIRGFAPTRIDNLNPGEHKILVRAEGYQDRNFTIRAYSGYQLTAVVELAKASQVPEVKAEVIKKVQILSTPNGFLRVREKPSTQSAELAQVQPGTTFNLKEEGSEWFKIEYAAGLFGWISSQYAQVIESSN